MAQPLVGMKPRTIAVERVEDGGWQVADYAFPWHNIDIAVDNSCQPPAEPEG